MGLPVSEASLGLVDRVAPRGQRGRRAPVAQAVRRVRRASGASGGRTAAAVSLAPAGRRGHREERGCEEKRGRAGRAAPRERLVSETHRHTRPRALLCTYLCNYVCTCTRTPSSSVFRPALAYDDCCGQRQLRQCCPHNSTPIQFDWLRLFSVG